MQTLFDVPAGAAAVPLPLREYQRAALDASHMEHEQGVTRQLISLPTGSGKTVVFCWLIKEVGRQAVVLVHRDELVGQTLDKLHTIMPGVHAGRVKAQYDELGYPVTVASVQTLQNKRRLSRLLASLTEPPLVISDECFPAGTLIDGRAIESIQVGDRVTAFREDGAAVQRSVTHIFRRTAPDRLLRVTAGSRTVVCTPDHPFFTTDGWRKAKALLRGAEVYTYDGDASGVLAMRGTGSAGQQRSSIALPEDRPRLLQRRVQAGVLAGGRVAAHGGDESPARFGTDEGQEPDGAGGNTGEGERVIAAQKPSTAGTGRQRARDDGRSSSIGARARLARGGDREDQRPAREPRPPTEPLQDRHRAHRLEDGNRGGRRQPQRSPGTGSGRAQRGVLTLVRVDRVEVLKPGRDGTFGGLCPDGHVYNLEVAGWHTYLANGFAVHNCHHDAAPTRRSILEALDPWRLVGVTATPVRGDKAPLAPIYQKIIYHQSMLDLMLQGRLARLTGLRIDTETDIDDVSTRAGELAEGELSNAVNTPARNTLIVRSWQAHAGDRLRTVAFCVTVDHAQQLRDAFRDAGIRAETIHGGTPEDERRRLLADFHDGRIPVLTNCAVLTEGYDEPRIDCILMARPTKSQALYTQCIGRASRNAEGKDDALIIDFVDNTRRHKLITLPSLGNEDDAGPDTSGGGDVDQREDGEQIDLLELAAARRALREKAAVEVDLFGASSYLWREVAGWHMAEAGQNVWLVLRSKDGGYIPWLIQRGANWDVEAKPLFERPLDLGYAMGVAENAAQPYTAAFPLVQRAASWRERVQEPTGKQLDLAGKMRIRVPRGATRAQVSRLIGDEIFRKLLRSVRWG